MVVLGTYLVNDACISKMLLIEVHKTKLLPRALGSIEDVSDAELGEEPRVLRRPPVPDEEAGTDLVTVTAPALGVERSEQPPVLGAFPGPHLMIGLVKTFILIIQMMIMMVDIILITLPASTLLVAAVWSLYQELWSLTASYSQDQHFYLL